MVLEIPLGSNNFLIFYSDMMHKPFAEEYDCFFCEFRGAHVSILHELQYFIGEIHMFFYLIIEILIRYVSDRKSVV